jgi:Cu/Zn superoxide dismutase
MNAFRQTLVFSAVSAVALVLAACGSTTVAPMASPSPSAAESPSAAPTPSAASGYTVALTAEGPGVGTVSGTVTATPGTDNTFTLVVTMAGLAPMSVHPSHIHAGASCDANGPVEIALQSVTADASGNATATTVVPQSYVVPATGWYVNVHQGPDLVGANAAPIACGVLA